MHRARQNGYGIVVVDDDNDDDDDDDADDDDDLAGAGAACCCFLRTIGVSRGVSVLCVLQDAQVSSDFQWDIATHVLPRPKSEVICPGNAVAIGSIGLIDFSMQSMGAEMI